MSKSRKVPERGAMPEAVNEALACALSPAELGAQQRDRMRKRMLQQARDTAPAGTTTLRAAAGEWEEVAPFIRWRVLRRDEVSGLQTVLMRMQPGGVIPAHRHEREEEFIILEGECHIGNHRLAAGDVHVAGAGSWHDAVTTQSGVLVLLRGEYPVPQPSIHAAP